MRTVRALAAAAAISAAGALNAGFSTYFLDGCPPNWTELAFTQGRLIVSVVDGNQSGLVLGEPLNDQEDRSHVHTFSGALTLTEKHISSIGCCDDDGAHNGADPYNGVTTNATSGLPFLQLFLCALSADDDTLSLPLGAVGYMNPNQTTACPAQWAPYEIAAGRAIITGDAPPGAQPVTSVDLPLANLEDRAHSHGEGGERRARVGRPNRRGGRTCAARALRHQRTSADPPLLLVLPVRVWRAALQTTQRS